VIGKALRRVPFRLRLALTFAGVMIVLFGGLALLLHTRFSTSLDEGIERSLRTRADDLDTLVSGGKGNRVEDLPPLPESGGAFAQILDPSSGRVVDSTPGHGRPLLNSAELARARRASVLIERREGDRLLARPLATAPPTVLVVGVSLVQRDRALTTLSELLFIGGPVLLVLTCLAGYVLAARALAPVEKMRGRAASISGAPRGDRLPVPEAKDELHRLGETLNAMLRRVEDAVWRERAFVSDAGHELRTPLSILKLQLDLTLESRGSREELESGLRSAAEEVDRLAKLSEDLLVIARADQGRLPLEKRRVDLRGLLGTVADRFAGPVQGTGRVVTVEDTNGLAIHADHERLEQALTNLVSNALRYGEGPVVLRAREWDGNVELHVLDEGEGFTPDFLPRAFDRFSRADPARARGGAGLGLSIVRVIAEAHGGRAYAANREEGGADVWVTLPR
jgi:two-component system, OmpR family, sensor kinase